MRTFLLFFAVIVMLAVSTMAQDAEVARLKYFSSLSAWGPRPASSSFSLLDFSRMTWSHSYSISFLSGGGSSGSMGLLNSSMFYEFSPALSLRLDIGVMHNSGAIWGNANNDATVFPGFLLDYHPSEKFNLTIGVSRYNPAMNPRYYPGIRHDRPGYMVYPY